MEAAASATEPGLDGKDSALIELSGLRIVELGGGVSAAWATKWLADLGVDVIKVEPPGGDPLRQRGPFRREGEGPDLEGAGFFHYLNANKRGIVLDLDLASDRRELEGVIASAEAVIHNLPVRRVEALGLGWEELRALQPRLTLCSISPFGMTGPRKHWRAEDLTTVNAGG
ncbi:MAG: CoA transferase, partial [Myxococcota bacterium]